MYHSVHSQRYGRAKGMKVKHLVQLVALTVLFTWFMYQLNSSHQAKVLSLHAEKEDVIDDELLISDDKGGYIRTGVASNDLTVDETIAEEEFIDRKSVLKSRKLLPDFSDIPELEQRITEVDRFDEVIHAQNVEDLIVRNDVGEGDMDDRGGRASSDDDGAVRRTAEVADFGKGGERANDRALEGHKRPLTDDGASSDTADDRGDGEDEVAESIGKELSGDSDGWTTTTNFTETEDDDTSIYRSEEIQVKGVDVSSDDERTLTSLSEAVIAAGKEETEGVARSKSLEHEQNILLLKKTRDEDGKNLAKQNEDGASDDRQESDGETESSGIAATRNFSKETGPDKPSVRNNETIASSSAENRRQNRLENGPENVAWPGSTSDKLSLVNEGRGRGSNFTGKANSGSRHDFQEETTGGGGDGHGNLVLHGDGQEEKESGERKHSVQEEDAIVEVVAEVVGKPQQDQSVVLLQEAIPEVVSLATTRDKRTDGA